MFTAPFEKFPSVAPDGRYFLFIIFVYAYEYYVCVGYENFCLRFGKRQTRIMVNHIDTDPGEISCCVRGELSETRFMSRCGISCLWR